MKGENEKVQSLIYTKFATALLKLPNAIGIYQNPLVIPPSHYIEGAEHIKNGELPILNWIYFGIYRNENKISGYTIGLNYFGKDEIEVLSVEKSWEDLYWFMVNISDYIVTSDVILRHGETIGFTAEEKLKIVRSEGVMVEGESVKIEF
ncbi:MAG: DUF4261 domain-containing protein [Fusobacteriaceae bacterium]|nr:DUF4261 domain-containing protein [Fusobacteriaceae bacterium]